MSVMRVTVFACMVATIGCDAVRPVRVPSEDLVVTPVHLRSALPDDCEVKLIDGECRIDGGRLVCPSAPLPEKMVAELMLCTWTREDEAKLRTAACRAGGDALMRGSFVTHRCYREDFDTDARIGAAGQFYYVYRLGHPTSRTDRSPSESPPSEEAYVPMLKLPARLADLQRWLRAIGAPNDCGGEHLFFWQDELGIRSGTCNAGPIKRGSATSTLKFRLEQRIIGTQTEELVVAVEAS